MLGCDPYSPFLCGLFFFGSSNVVAKVLTERMLSKNVLSEKVVTEKLQPERVAMLPIDHLHPIYQYNHIVITI